MNLRDSMWVAHRRLTKCKIIQALKDTDNRPRTTMNIAYFMLRILTEAEAMYYLNDMTTGGTNQVLTEALVESGFYRVVDGHIETV
jgi:hypothetical protein